MQVCDQRLEIDKMNHAQRDGVSQRIFTMVHEHLFFLSPTITTLVIRLGIAKSVPWYSTDLGNRSIATYVAK